jgi:hypothetical protein
MLQNMCKVKMAKIRQKQFKKSPTLVVPNAWQTQTHKAISASATVFNTPINSTAMEACTTTAGGILGRIRVASVTLKK